MVPAFKGLGYAMIFVRFLVNIYYVVITAWSLYYLAVGFASELPWGTCNESWNTWDCYTLKEELKCQENNTESAYDGMEFTYYKQGCVTIFDYCKEHGYKDAIFRENVI